MDSISFHGRGLHTGERCGVTLRRVEGPVRFERGSDAVAREELEVSSVDHGVRVRAPSLNFEVELVEHLFAALAGLSVQNGIAIGVDGLEIPLLDGSALELALAVRALGPPRSPPRLRVVKAAALEVGESTYHFAPNATVSVEVDVEFEGVAPQRARWDGTVPSFFADIAPARTFGFRRDAMRLRARGRAAHVDPYAVLVLEDDGRVLPPCPPARPHELARHKLLDLLGDLYLFGGPLLGRIHAERPGHARNHEALRRALEQGIVART